jgi:Fe-S-cluster containining protein
MSEFLVDGKWKCTACGACCKNVWPLLKKGFPQQWVNKKGGCKNQTNKGKCQIYENRPAICRIAITLKTSTDLEIANFCTKMKEHEDAKRIPRENKVS